MKTFNTKLLLYFLGLCLGFSFILPANSQIVLKLTCNGASGSENVTVSGIQSISTDSLEAVREYARHAAASSKAICIKPENCTGDAGCNKVCIGINGIGKFPAPKKTPLGYWKFPDLTVTVHLQCVCQVPAIIFEVEDVNPNEIPFEPLIGNDDTSDDNSELRNFKRSPEIQVYPNPVRSDLNIEFKDFEKSGIYSVNIFNSLGTLMDNQKISVSSNSPYIHSIKASGYTSGVYYVLINDKTNIVASSKFVVSNE